ncbi:MAG: hypothetical protein PHQ98_04590 [Candidatus ainarchaeum sp.]|nr:hypothetical protein [Candidatus ainarchaeum sp.]
MNYKRIILIGTTLLVCAWLTIQVYIWSQKYKDRFFYQDNYLGWIMIFAFIFAITGIFKWFLKWELKATRK